MSGLREQYKTDTTFFKSSTTVTMQTENPEAFNVLIAHIKDVLKLEGFKNVHAQPTRVNVEDENGKKTTVSGYIFSFYEKRKENINDIIRYQEKVKQFQKIIKTTVDTWPQFEELGIGQIAQVCLEAADEIVPPVQNTSSPQP